MPLARFVGLLLSLMPKPEPLPPTLVQELPDGMALEHAREESEDLPHAVVLRARAEVERGVVYDRSYRVGAVPEGRGACTDLVIRALRAAGVDLQTLVDDDMHAAPEIYKRRIDYHGDYRRVAVLSTYFARHVPVVDSKLSEPSTFRPGDVLFTSPQKPCKPHRPCKATHVALVSDRIGPRGLPLVIQNGGPVATESDVLSEKTVLVAHYRWTFAYARRNDATK